MNPKAKHFRCNPCVVCGYPFSDEHHVFPKIKGGKETVSLCPNHHRFANIVQVIMDQNMWHGEKIARSFAAKHFDSRFNNAMLNRLIGDYIGTAADLSDSEFNNAATAKVDAPKEVQELALAATLERLNSKYA